MLVAGPIASSIASRSTGRGGVRDEVGRAPACGGRCGNCRLGKQDRAVLIGAAAATTVYSPETLSATIPRASGADRERLRKIRCGGRSSCSFQLRITNRPILLDQSALPLDRGAGQSAERIAVEIDQAVGQEEAVAAPAQRIGGVERADLLDRAVHRLSALSISRTVAAQAAVSGAISSTWPVRSIIRTFTESPAARIGLA